MMYVLNKRSALENLFVVWEIQSKLQERNGTLVNEAAVEYFESMPYDFY